MSKHTPGPWVVECDPSKLDLKTHIMTKCGLAIADVMPEYSSIQNEDECEANARLIAAAPELLKSNQHMLDSLMKLVSALEGLPLYKELNSIKEAKIRMEESRAAIAKAKGE